MSRALLCLGLAVPSAHAADAVVSATLWKQAAQGQFLGDWNDRQNATSQTWYAGLDKLGKLQADSALALLRQEQKPVVDLFGLEVPAASLFYGLQAASLVFLWLYVWFSGGGDFYRHAFQCSVAVRPTWLPPRCLLFLHRPEVYLPICYSVPPLQA
eukprot:CAMPEP_0175571764 /NCGR_PEP_ID=MMETSP0096-20121207/42669_1 /TAXON_ID=311494 /ORGANISM="Alexandrium monilatum, Strain CCMP3105" /LENGTH=155 /DNA_ID=CAMNT_0016875175 /DNA_START=64 /DNA_END=527 /DNA_ORIENTATION=+